jgi:hypothetical protein
VISLFISLQSVLFRRQPYAICSSTLRLLNRATFFHGQIGEIPLPPRLGMLD